MMVAVNFEGFYFSPVEFHFFSPARDEAETQQCLAFGGLCIEEANDKAFAVTPHRRDLDSLIGAQEPA